ncbi:MAG TPA: hypothetical protein VNK82_13490 [Terriglobales bacterium]|nr:hypothetical protein [Terriglobales bacterium]
MSKQEVHNEPAAEPGSIRIQNFYSGYEPPFDAYILVSRLIEAVSAKYLRGLDCIVLTNSSALSHDRRRESTTARGRKFRVSDARGAYHHKRNNQPAWVEIFVDRIVQGSERSLRWKIPLIREMIVGEVVYHELGHHVHEALRPEFREREDVADDWSKRFLSLYLRRKYWYLLPVVYLLNLFLRVGRALRLVDQS